MQHTLTRSLVLLLCSSLIALASALTQTPAGSHEAESHSHEETEAHSHNEASASHRHTQDAASNSHQETTEQGMDRMAMYDMDMTADSEASFITQMIPHHQEAVTSSPALLRTTDDLVLRDLARPIIETQSREIHTLRGWHTRWCSDAPPAHYMPMMPERRGPGSPEAERAFLEGMIGHHERALEMARSYLGGDFDKHPEVVRLACAIVVAKRGEVAQMQTWLGVWFGEREAVSPAALPKTHTHGSSGHGSH